MIKQQFYTKNQIAQFCGVQYQCVHRWIKEGILKAERHEITPKIRITSEQFEEFLQNNPKYRMRITG